MDRNAKLRVAVVAVVALALISIFIGQPLLAVAVVILGGIGIFVLLRQGSDDDGADDAPVRTKGPKAKKGKARLDEILDDKAAQSGSAKTAKRPITPTAPSGGLPTWTPGSVDGDIDSADDLDDGDSSWDSWEKEWPQEGDAETLLLDEDDDDPLRSLDRLDDIDPVAEIERLDEADDPFASLRTDIEIDDTFALDDEAFELDELEELGVDLGDDEPAPVASGSAFSFAAAPAVINEEVATADDIMAASTATELHTEDAGDSELARLLAKVQARLSAYE